MTDPFGVADDLADGHLTGPAHYRHAEALLHASHRTLAADRAAVYAAQATAHFAAAKIAHDAHLADHKSREWAADREHWRATLR